MPTIEQVASAIGKDRIALECEQTAPGHFRPVSVIIRGRELGTHVWEFRDLLAGNRCLCGEYSLGKFEHLIMKQTAFGRLKLWWCRMCFRWRFRYWR